MNEALDTYELLTKLNGALVLSGTLALLAFVAINGIDRRQSLGPRSVVFLFVACGLWSLDYFIKLDSAASDSLGLTVAAAFCAAVWPELSDRESRRRGWRVALYVSAVGATIGLVSGYVARELGFMRTDDADALVLWTQALFNCLTLCAVGAAFVVSAAVEESGLGSGRMARFVRPIGAVTMSYGFVQLAVLFVPLDKGAAHQILLAATALLKMPMFLGLVAWVEGGYRERQRARQLEAEQELQRHTDGALQALVGVRSWARLREEVARHIGEICQASSTELWLRADRPGEGPEGQPGFVSAASWQAGGAAVLRSSGFRTLNDLIVERVRGDAYDVEWLSIDNGNLGYVAVFDPDRRTGWDGSGRRAAARLLLDVVPLIHRGLERSSLYEERKAVERLVADVVEPSSVDAAEAIRAAMNADGVGLWAVEGEGLRPVACAGLDPDLFSQVEYRPGVGDGLSLIAVRQMRSMLHSDVYDNAEANQATVQLLERALGKPIESWMGMPVVIDGRCRLLVKVLNRQQDAGFAPVAYHDRQSLVRLEKLGRVLGGLISRGEMLAAAMQAREAAVVAETSARAKLEEAEAKATQAVADREHAVVARDFAIAERENTMREASLLAHELKSPIGAIQFIARRTKKRATENRLSVHGPGGLDAALDDILNECERHMSLVVNLREYLQIVLGTRDPRRARFDLTSLVTRVVERVVASSQNRTWRTHIQVDAPLKLEIESDEELLEHAIENVVDNAVKYGVQNEFETIVIKVAQPNPKAVAVEVIDCGVGIPLGERDAIYELFGRGSGIARRQQGTGLGLYLVRRTMNLLRGSVSHRANDRVGTTFTLVLPIRVRP